MATLFEYGKWEGIQNREALNQMLLDIWAQRLFVGEFESSEENKHKQYQPFLQFEGNSVRANNFVGFVQNGTDLIEIYPKVFRNILPSASANEKLLMLRHI